MLDVAVVANWRFESHARIAEGATEKVALVVATGAPPPPPMAPTLLVVRA